MKTHSSPCCCTHGLGLVLLGRMFAVSMLSISLTSSSEVELGDLWHKEKIRRQEVKGEWEIAVLFHNPGGGRGGGALPVMNYTGKFRPRRAQFSNWKYIKGAGIS